MNLLHRWICRSPYWKLAVETQLVPWALDRLDLGSQAIEIGPGYGLTTDVLRTRVASLSCIEVDSGLARVLSRRYKGTNVTILNADATCMPFPDASFHSVLCFTMLHHLPSAGLQDRLLREAARVLHPGGIFAGTDSLSSTVFRLLHIGDVMTPVDWRTFPARLQAAGFTGVEIDRDSHSFRFRARKGP